MTDGPPRILDGILTDDQLTVLEQALVEHPRYIPSSYSRRPASAGASGSGPDAQERVGWRYDVASHFVTTGGRLGRIEPQEVLAPRNNYFRGNFVHAGRIERAGVEAVLRAETLVDAARALHGRPVVRPEWMYANILLPGQELAVHTDVPEFVGARRNHLPGWLLVVMGHSSLFESIRIPVATAVLYLTTTRAGGGFFYYLGSEPGQDHVLAPQPNRAVILDADTIFHGVDPVPGDDAPLRRLTASSRLCPRGDHEWVLEGDETELAVYASEDLRCSVSWKALCFADQAELLRFDLPEIVLSRRVIVDQLFGELRRRGRVERRLGPQTDREVADRLIREFVSFPTLALTR